MERRDVAIIVALFSVSFLIRFWGVPNISMYPDEWIYWTDMHRILSSNFAPRPDIFNYTSPFFSYIGSASTFSFGNDLNTVRIISVLFGSMTIPFLYLFGKEMYNRKTGLLAALLFGFCAYHSLYSRIIMLEAFSIFFITAFLYFFWRTQCPEKDQKSLISAIVAGAMMGLAIDAKYISFFLVPAVIGYILWTTKFDFKALLEKKILVMFFCAFLFFLPLLFCLFYTGVGFHGMMYYSIQKYEKPGAQSRLSSLPITEIITRGTDTITGVFAWGSDKLNPSGQILFNFAVIVLIIITVVFYLFSFARREKEGSFLIISVFLLHILFFVVSPYKHYYNYTLPFYFLMLSHFIIKGIEKNKWSQSISGAFIAILAIIMISFTLYTGVTSPLWDKGEYSGIDSAIDLIKNDLYANNVGGPVLIGTTFREVVSEYSAYKQGFGASHNRIIQLTGEFERNKYKTDLDKINQYQPDYIIFAELTYGRFYFNTAVKENLLEKNYRIIRDYHQYFLEYILVKRITPPERNVSILYEENKKGEISEDIFKASIPSVMKVGKAYPAKIEIKNTGDTRTTYYIALSSDKFIIFVDKPVIATITLDGGTTGTLQYNLVPFKEYAGELPVGLEVYIIPENLPPDAALDLQYENWARQRMDSVTAVVNRIVL